MERVRRLLRELGYQDRDTIETSSKRFPDGAQYRVEIPSVEGPRVLEAVLKKCEEYEIQIDRVSQGSGIMLMTDSEIKEMAAMGREAAIEVSLFVGPRAPFDIGAQPLTSAGKNLGWRLEGYEQLVYAMEDVYRAAELGIRSVLVADEGVLWLVDQARTRGELPSNFVAKVSVLLGASNPISIARLQEIGATTFNVPTDLTLPRLSAIRQAVNMPLDIYVEAPDDFGGFIRHYDIPEIVRVAAPVYIKFGLRNAPNIYPSGLHLEQTARQLAEERVRRAKIGLDMINRYAPHLIRSQVGAADLGIPVL